MGMLLTKTRDQRRAVFTPVLGMVKLTVQRQRALSSPNYPSYSEITTEHSHLQQVLGTMSPNPEVFIAKPQTSVREAIFLQRISEQRETLAVIILKQRSRAEQGPWQQPTSNGSVLCVCLLHVDIITTQEWQIKLKSYSLLKALPFNTKSLSSQVVCSTMVDHVFQHRITII